MPASKMLLLVAVFFLTSVISVVMGSTSLITVPVMIAVGIEPHVAVATNMMALIFMSAGGSLPFARKGVLEGRLQPLSIVLTLIGSAMGAFLLLHSCQNTSTDDCSCDDCGRRVLAREKGKWHKRTRRGSPDKSSTQTGQMSL